MSIAQIGIFTIASFMIFNIGIELYDIENHSDKFPKHYIEKDYEVSFKSEYITNQNDTVYNIILLSPDNEEITETCSKEEYDFVENGNIVKKLVIKDKSRLLYYGKMGGIFVAMLILLAIFSSSKSFDLLDIK